MFRILPSLFFAAAIAACATASGAPAGRISDELIVFPTPPDTPRIQFLFTLTSEDDVRPKQQGWLSTFLDEASTDGVINKPYGVDYYADRFYVCDSMLPGVDIIDLGTQEFTQWRPTGLGELKKPINCSIDQEDGTLFVTDTERGQVVVFDSAGTYVTSFGEEEGTPLDVVVEGDRIWVADLSAHRVHVYDKASRALVSSFPDVDSDSEAFLRQPTNLSVDDGRVYVSDFGAFNIKVFRTDGTFERTIGSYGRGLGQFSRPKGIAVDRDGRLYVVDAGFQNVQVFDREGQLLLYFGGPYQGPGSMWLPAKVRVSYEGLERFEPYVDPGFSLEHVILVTNQYGPDRLNVYGFVRPRATVVER